MRAIPQQSKQSMTRDEIASVVRTLSDLLAVLRAADPADKAQIYVQLGLRLTYEPPEPGEDPIVRVEVHIVPAQHWHFESVRGPSRRLHTCPLSLVS
jgi:site-specific DNA recombinase